MKNKIISPDDHRLDANKNLKWSILFSILSGVLLILSFPKYGFGFVAWFAFIPLLFALYRATSISQAILLGFITGVVGYTGIIYWIVYVVVNYGYLPVYFGIIIMLLLACYLSIYLALFAAGIVYFKKTIPLYLIAPVLWVGLEYCKSQLVNWLSLGESWLFSVS